MILYLAALSSYLDLLPRIGRSNILTSYVETKRPDRELCERIFLDSGAYTAKSSGKEIALRDYIDFCHKHKDAFDVICGLDVIGDPKQSVENQKGV
jgi:hypothetical protein